MGKGQMTVFNDHQTSKLTKTKLKGIISGDFKTLDKVQGTLQRPSGERWEGMILEGEADGQGVLTNVDGSKFQGLQKRGIKQGRGKFTKSGKVHEGFWVNNEKCQMFDENKGIFLDDDKVVIPDNESSDDEPDETK